MTLLWILSPLRLYPADNLCKDFLRASLEAIANPHPEIAPYFGFRRYFSTARSVAILRKSFSTATFAVSRSFL